MSGNYTEITAPMKIEARILLDYGYPLTGRKNVAILD